MVVGRLGAGTAAGPSATRATETITYERKKKTAGKLASPQVSLEAGVISGSRPDQIQDHLQGLAKLDRYCQIGLGFLRGPSPKTFGTCRSEPNIFIRESCNEVSGSYLGFE